MFMERVPDMTTSFLLHKYWLNYWLIRCLLNFLEWVDQSWRDSDWRESSWNFCDTKLQNFCAQCFQLQIIFALRIFENVVASNVFTLSFTFRCTMPRHVLVVEIISTSVEATEATNIYWWDYVTAIPPNITIPLEFQ